MKSSNMSKSAKFILKSVANNMIQRSDQQVQLTIKEMKVNLKKSLKDMVFSFNESIYYLSRERFSVEYNPATGEIKVPEGDKLTANKVKKDNMMSYFSDFIQMQKLMTIETQIQYQEVKRILSEYSFEDENNP